MSHRHLNPTALGEIKFWEKSKYAFSLSFVLFSFCHRSFVEAQSKPSRMASLVLSYTFISVNGLQSKFWFLSLLLFKTIDIKLKHEREKKRLFSLHEEPQPCFTFSIWIQLLFVSCLHTASCIWILAGEVALAELADALSNSKQCCRLCYCPLPLPHSYLNPF